MLTLPDDSSAYPTDNPSLDHFQPLDLELGRIIKGNLKLESGRLIEREVFMLYHSHCQLPQTGRPGQLQYQLIQL